MERLNFNTLGQWILEKSNEDGAFDRDFSTFGQNPMNIHSDRVKNFYNHKSADVMSGRIESSPQIADDTSAKAEQASSAAHALGSDSSHEKRMSAFVHAAALHDEAGAHHEKSGNIEKAKYHYGQHKKLSLLADKVNKEGWDAFHEKHPLSEPKQSVSVNKSDEGHPDPTPEMAEELSRQAAAAHEISNNAGWSGTGGKDHQSAIDAANAHARAALAHDAVGNKTKANYHEALSRSLMHEAKLRSNNTKRSSLL